MRALLDLITKVEDARALIRIVTKLGGVVQHKTHQRPLDDDIISEGSFTTNFGGYGSRSRLNLGPKFSGSWQIVGVEIPKGKPLSGLKMFFQGEDWALKFEDIKGIVVKLGGEIVDRSEAAHIHVVSKNIPLEASFDRLVISESVLQRLSAFSPPSHAKKKLAKPLTGDSVGIWKLLCSRDRASIDQGIALAAALPEELEQLLSTCEVSASGDLIRGSRFTSTGPAQRFLDLALLGLLSIAPGSTVGADLRSRVKKLTLSTAGLPQLEGFLSLEDLEITFPSGVQLPNLRALGALPSLKSLSILPEGEIYSRAKVKLSSTEGLIAPNLERLTLIALNLERATGVSNYSKLKWIDLSENVDLQEFSGEEGVLLNVESINFSKCRHLKSLRVLSSSSICRVNLKDCASLEDLDFLSTSKSFEQLVIAGCSKITTLNPLNGSSLGGQKTEDDLFELVGCDSLTDISGFPSLSHPVSRVDITDLYELSELTGLENASCIKDLRMQGLAVKDLSSLAGFHRLEELDAARCDELMDASAIGALESLKKVNFQGCSDLSLMPKVWGDRLESLNVLGCTSIKDLGHLPASLQSLSEDDELISLKGCSNLESLSGARLGDFYKVRQIDLSGCKSLKSLEGLESTESLNSIQVPAYVRDVSALGGNRKFELTIDLKGLNEFPDELAKSISILNSPKLKIKNGDDLEDCSSLAACKNLIELDLSSTYKLSNLGWIVGMPKLENIRLAVGSPISKEMKGTHYDSVAKVKSLQFELCRVDGCELPDYVCANEEDAKPEVSKRIAVKDVRKSLTGADFLAAVETVKKIANSLDEQIYTELLNDVDTDLLFDDSDSPFESGIFKGVKASARPQAKLVILWLLATAPTTNEFVLDRRQGIRKIELKFKAPLTGNVLPDLGCFPSLREVSIDQVDFLNLKPFADAVGLRTLSISNAERITSLSGLERLQKLQSLSLYGCPSLTDLSVIENLPNLKDLSAYDTGPINDLSFVKQLKRFNDLFLTISPQVNLSVLKECPWIEEATFYLKPGEKIQIDLEMKGLNRLSIRSTSPWNEEVSKPQIIFKNLVAPKLESLNFFGVTLSNFNGICSVKDIDFYYASLNSLVGIEKTNVISLGLRGVDNVPESIQSLASTSSLRRLTLPNDETVGRSLPMDSFMAMSQVEELETTWLSGSVQWLSGWNSLSELSLDNSERLIDLEVLEQLPKLRTLSLRRSAVNKDDLPESIQVKSTFK
jgi:hypothetical protein